MEEYQVMIQSREWLVGWGTLSLINAGLAQGKNRSGLLWWILSLIFGPLATLVIVLLSKVPDRSLR
ncbi:MULTISPECIES: antitermination protein NusB [Microbulbifer]|uniref:Antitermination protein NusB n=1 Tax=Microbulbifer celer TaxID=435905 RepID=A0ABW3UC23_9GAMM|nr:MULTISPECIES: antitermination protein NusB [Microbulbifer]UFN57321.1 antitermination protein NusB [Microbulbifer celer]